MSEYLIQSETLTGIADAIREKKGTSDPILVSNFASEIESIQADGGENKLALVMGAQDVTLRPYSIIPSDWGDYIPTDLGYYRFYRCTGLISAELPEGIENINSSAFNYCSNLTTLTLPSTIKTTSSSSFANCSKLNTVNFNGTVEDWFNISFYTNYDGCPMYADAFNSLYINGTLVENLVVPDTITKLSGYVCYNVGTLVTVQLPDTITTVGSECFMKCDNLTTINIPAQLKNTGNGFCGNCVSLSTVNIPENSQLLTIGNSCFLGCKSLTEIQLPSTCTSIGSQAFQNTALYNITLPAASISGSAFYKCGLLESVTFNAGTTLSAGSWSSGHFSTCNNLLKVYNLENTTNTAIPANGFNACRITK